MRLVGYEVGLPVFRSEQLANAGGIIGDSATGNGVPSAIFELGFEARIITPSGNKLQCWATEQEIGILDVTDPRDYGVQRRHFEATLLTRYGKPSLMLGICNRNTLSNNPDVRHPDLFPARLLDRTVQYFERDVLQEVPLRYLEGHWPTDNPFLADNTGQYLAYKAALGVERLTPEQRAVAARTTWTGKQAIRLGFNEVTAYERRRTYIDAYFKRPLAR